MSYLINKTYENTIIINKSKFIAYAYRVNSVDEVNDILKDLHKKYYDSTHICYGYILDQGMIQKAFDDGEPAKTAGYPILDVLKKKDMDNILVAVIRYFGGILLGANGLVKAYSSSCSEVLKNAILYEYKTVLTFDLTLSYKEYDTLTNINDIKIIEQNFLNDVHVKCVIDENKKDGIDSILISNNIEVKPSNIKIATTEIKI